MYVREYICGYKIHVECASVDMKIMIQHAHRESLLNCALRCTDTGWRRLIGSPKLQIIFRKRATKYRSLLRKMTYKTKGSYESSPPCTRCCVIYTNIYICIRIYECMCVIVCVCVFLLHIPVVFVYLNTHTHIALSLSLSDTHTHCEGRHCRLFVCISLCYTHTLCRHQI